MENIESALDTFKQMLSTPEGQNSISSLLGAFGGSEETSAAPTIAEPTTPQMQNMPLSGLNDLSPDVIMKMTSMLGTLQNQSGPHFDLLYALRPYLSTKKQGRFEIALRMLQLSKIPQIRGIFNIGGE